MKLDYLVDTNILISLFNQELMEPIPNGNIGYSTITAIELLSFKGLTSEKENGIRSSLQCLIQVPLNEAISEKTILLRRKFGLKIPDAIITASAWDCDAALITNDKQLLNIEDIKSLSLSLKENN